MCVFVHVGPCVHVRLVVPCVWGSYQISQAAHVSARKALLNPNIFSQLLSPRPSLSRAFRLSLGEGGKKREKPRFLREGREERKGRQAQRRR